MKPPLVKLDFDKFEPAFKYKFSLLVDWAYCEDEMLPEHDKLTPKSKELNANRHGWFRFEVGIMDWVITLKIRLKKVGYVFYGTDLTPRSKNDL